jgi:hypothetical protein
LTNPLVSLQAYLSFLYFLFKSSSSLPPDRILRYDDVFQYYEDKFEMHLSNEAIKKEVDEELKQKEKVQNRSSNDYESDEEAFSSYQQEKEIIENPLLNWNLLYVIQPFHIPIKVCLLLLNCFDRRLSYLDGNYHKFIDFTLKPSNHCIIETEYCSLSSLLNSCAKGFYELMMNNSTDQEIMINELCTICVTGNVESLSVNSPSTAPASFPTSSSPSPASVLKNISTISIQLFSFYLKTGSVKFPYGSASLEKGKVFSYFVGKEKSSLVQELSPLFQDSSSSLSLSFSSIPSEKLLNNKFITFPLLEHWILSISSAKPEYITKDVSGTAGYIAFLFKNKIFLSDIYQRMRIEWLNLFLVFFHFVYGVLNENTSYVSASEESMNLQKNLFSYLFYFIDELYYGLCSALEFIEVKVRFDFFHSFSFFIISNYCFSFI